MKTLILILILVLSAQLVFAECIEYKIIDHGDRYEAVCIGSGSQSSSKSGSYIQLKKETYFDHSRHTSYNCDTCHSSGNNPGRINGFGKDWAHKNCKGCHADSRRGPTACKDCHKGNSSASSTSSVPSSSSFTATTSNLSEIERLKAEKELIRAENDLKTEQLRKDKLNKQEKESKRLTPDTPSNSSNPYNIPKIKTEVYRYKKNE